MRKHLLITGAFLFGSIVLSSAQISFQKIIGSMNSDQMSSGQQTTDGGYIFAGFTNSFGAGSYDVYLIKTDANGDTLWTKTFGGTGAEGANTVQQTTDGGFIICGYTNSFGAGSQDVYLIKTDTVGNLLWSKTFGGALDEQGSYVQQTTDGGFIITGFTSFGVSTYYNVYLIRTDSIGVMLWSKTYGGTPNGDAGYSVDQTTDGGFILTGFTTNFGAGGADIYLIKTDSNGDTLWTKAYGGFNTEDGTCVRQTTDGGYIISGGTVSFGSGDYDAYLIKTDSVGNTLWSKAYGGVEDDYFYSVQQTTDGGYICVGNAESGGPGSDDVYLIKTNANGDTLWTRAYGVYGGGNSEIGFCVQQTADGGYVIAGDSWNFGQNVSLIKTNSSGSSGCKEFSTATYVTIPATQVTNMAAIITSPLTIETVPATITGSHSAQVYTACNCFAYFTLYADTVPHNWIAVNQASGVAPFTYLWSWGDSTTSGGATPSHMYATPGYYNICLTISDSTGCTSTYCDSSTYIFRGNSNNTVVTINVQMPTAINVPGQNAIENAITIYPNPSSGNFVITFPRIINMGEIELYNILGKRVYSEKINNQSDKEIHLKNISAGIYFVKVFEGIKSYSRKLIVERN